MGFDPKAITVFLDASPSGERRAAHAAAFAQRWGAHLVGAYVVYNNAKTHPSMAYARSEKAIAGVIAHERKVENACECAADEVCAHFQSLCRRLNVSAEFRKIDRGNPAQMAIINSLHSDLLVIGHPEPSGLPDEISAEKILVASGVPVLIVPNDWQGGAIGENVMIGWNGSPEARRAISGAMSFLVAASAVTALIVDPAGFMGLSEAAGCDIAEHLARHGARVQVEETNSGGRPIAEVILDRARRTGADLLVVGARNPAHLREILFGNATRTLLTKMPVPVLLSQ
ncbi:MAG TPA: universal stress protein [Caulobacteraceae bacterium]|jgi:nucleotide-binding universal stress UspA family protein|nr:universal stress protein [Caulobacteraceae bacterium]